MKVVQGRTPSSRYGSVRPWLFQALEVQLPLAQSSRLEHPPRGHRPCLSLSATLAPLCIRTPVTLDPGPRYSSVISPSQLTRQGLLLPIKRIHTRLCRLE